MPGLKIVVLAARQVLGDFSAAVRISVPAVAATLAFSLVAFDFVPRGSGAGYSPAGQAALFHSQSLALWAGLLLVTVLASAWSAIGWHRHVLRGERPGLFAPAFHGATFLSYLLATLRLTLAVLVPGLVLILAIMAIMGLIRPGLTVEILAGSWGPVMGTLVAVFLGWWAMRLSLILPGAAVGQRWTLGESWRETGRINMAIVTATFVLVLFGAGLDRAGGLFADPVAHLVWRQLANWASQMLSIAVLTVIYGHLAEGRPLD